MASSLFDIAQRACQKNIADLEDVGDLRYEILVPILRRIENPAQLRRIEEASPHIAEDDAELWQHFIKRDIQNGEAKLHTHRPKNPLSWWKVYRKLRAQDEAERKAAEDALKAALNKHKTDREAKATNIVRAVIPSGEKRNTWGAPRAAPSGERALKNARTTQDKLTVLKRQTAQRQSGRSVAQSVPSHQLQQMRGRVTQAPASMVRQYTGKPAISKPPPPIPQSQNNYRPVFVPKPQTHADRALTTAIQQTKREQESQRKAQEEREQRLRALTGASTAAPSSSSFQPTAPQAKKRPAYDPFLPAKRRRP